MIIAVDFDGVLAEDNGQFPAIGPPIYQMIHFVKELIKTGHEVVLWTSRTDDALQKAVEWCDDFGLHFCAVNENAPSNMAKYASEYPNGTRKVSADIYIDDHNPAFLINKLTVFNEYAVENTISTIRRIIKWKEEN